MSILLHACNWQCANKFRIFLNTLILSLIMRNISLRYMYIKEIMTFDLMEWRNEMLSARQVQEMHSVLSKLCKKKLLQVIQITITRCDCDDSGIENFGLHCGNDVVGECGRSTLTSFTYIILQLSTYLLAECGGSRQVYKYHTVRTTTHN